MKPFLAIHRFLDEQNFPTHEQLAVTLTVNTANGQARLVDALCADSTPMTVETAAHADAEKSKKIATGTCYGIPFKIERRQ